MLKAYRDHAAERTALGLPPLPLNAEQTAALMRTIEEPARRRGKLSSSTCWKTVSLPAWTTRPK